MSALDARFATRARDARGRGPVTFGRGSASSGTGKLDYVIFNSPLQSSLVPVMALGSATPTFTRASTAYVIDWEGLYKLVLSGESRFTGARRVYNLIGTTSAVLTDASWGTPDGSLTVTGGVSDPDGGTSAYTLTASGASQRFINVNVNPGGTQSITESIYIRRRTGTGQISRYNGAAYVAITGITSSWQRFSFTDSAITSFIVAFRVDVSGDAIDVWHPQYEVVTGQATTAASEYVSVGVASAPYHGANVDGVKYFTTLNGNTVASNVVTEATGAAITNANSSWADAGGPFGYQAEGARADVLGTTAAIRRTMTDAGWVVGATMTVGSATGVDGVASAGASLTGGAVEATNTILFTTVLASAARTYCAWVRRKTGTGTVRMTDNGGTNWTDITLTTTYQQFQLTRTQANPIVGFQIATNLDAIEVDFNTIEAAAFANPTPIPVNVSKAADVLTYPAANNVESTNGSWYYEVTSTLWSSTSSMWAISYENGLGTPAVLFATLSGVQGYDGTVTANGPAGTPAGTMKHAGFYSASASLQQVFANGSAGASGRAFDGSMNVGTSLTIAALGGGTNQPFCTIRNVRLYVQALPAATLQAMTG